MTTRPRSIVETFPVVSSSTAPEISTGMPSDLAKSFDVPRGRTAITRPLSASWLATAPTVPSPPAATTTGAAPSLAWR